MWLHVFCDFGMVFLVLSATLLDCYMANFLCCSWSFTIFFSLWFWFRTFSVCFYVFKCFSTIFFNILKQESHHFLIVIILVLFSGVLVYSLYVCFYLSRCQVPKRFIWPKICIVNVTSWFSCFSLGDLDTLLKNSCNYFMRSYF